MISLLQITNIVILVIYKLRHTDSISRGNEIEEGRCEMIVAICIVIAWMLIFWRILN